MYLLTFLTDSDKTTSSPTSHQSSTYDVRTLELYEGPCRLCPAPVTMTIQITMMINRELTPNLY